MMNLARFILTLSSVALLRSVHADTSYLNVNGDQLQPCSSDGMALTGYTRTGYCVDKNDDGGSHHICIDLSSADGGNFCTVTGQSDWCSSTSACDGNSDETCSITNWCVCQWAFASYLQKAGGCDMIQDIVCESINLEAVLAYQREGGSKYTTALNCLVSRCGLDLSQSYLQASKSPMNTIKSAASSAWFLSALVVSFVGVVVYKKVKYPSEGNSPARDTLLVKTPGREMKPIV
jgi:uncharacterized protein (DUF2237 family)